MTFFEFAERNPWLTFFLCCVAAWGVTGFAYGIGSLGGRRK